MKLAINQEMNQEMKTQLQLEAHERECQMFRELVLGKIDTLDKRMWRLEALVMASTLSIIAAVAALLLR